MAKIAILGFGNIGSGVLEVLRQNGAALTQRAGQPLDVKYIMDVRDFSQSPDAKLFVNNVDVILEDAEVSTVVETIGGTDPAYYYVKSALCAGKNVCTSNKELVARHGAELIALAKQHKVAFLFEASVGGGMPLIAPIRGSLAANVIESVHGIVNGTTNFMLTRMEEEGMDFAAALAEAQRLGYAETRDPSADVDGFDAGRKIAILASLLYGTEVHPEDIPTTGIREVAPADFYFAQRMKATIRLIAYAKKDEAGRFACAVEPMFIPREHPFAGVCDVFNAVMLRGNMLGDTMFYGKGAGKLPTASAVVADIIDAEKYGVSLHDTLTWNSAKSLGEITDESRYTYYIRVTDPDAEMLKKVLGGTQFMMQHGDEAAVLSCPLTETELAEKTQQLAAQGMKAMLCLKMLEQ